MSSGPSHYAVLGVHPSASAAEIREAYRDLARRYHPDRNAASAAGADRMPQVNEAYRVLSDPARRAVYDASLRSGPSRPSSSPSGHARAQPGHGDHDDDYALRVRALQRPIRVPWRTVAVFAGLGVIAVFVLAQFGGSGGEQPIDNIMRIGDCAEVLPDGRAAEVPCTGSGDLVVRALIPFESRCDFGLEQHQDRQGMGNVCLERVP